MARRVMIGTPAHDFKVHCRYANSLTSTTRMAVERGIFLREIYIAGDALVQNARNDLVKAALEQNFDDLIMIDADQDWEPTWIFKLLEYSVDCVGAAVRKKTDEKEVYNVKADKGPLSFVQHPTHPILTTPDMALGTGFLRFSNRALRVLWDNSTPYYVWGRDEGRWIFDVRPREDGQLVGEDTHVSNQLRKFGIDTWLDPNMTCGHMGEKRYIGDFASWLRNAIDQAKQAAAA